MENPFRTSLFAALLFLHFAPLGVYAQEKQKKEEKPAAPPSAAPNEESIRHGAHNKDRRTKHSIQSDGRSHTAEKCEGRTDSVGLLDFIHAKRCERYGPTPYRIHIQRWTRIFIDLAAHGCLWAAPRRDGERGFNATGTLQAIGQCEFVGG